MKKYLGIASVGLLLILALIWMISAQEAPVDFNAEVRPIFNNNCISCHGGVKKSGDFSLLFRHEALEAAESGLRAIVPGKPDSSELLRRLTHPDPETRMPLDADPLTEAEIATLRKWIKQGAKWEEHWAYIPPDPNVEVPDINDSWVQNDIDRFVWEKLDEMDLQPSEKASKEVLLRRASLDLIGIPPDLNMLDDFLANENPDAYEKVLDQLLASPHFGERWATMWLDLARYGDSQGYQKDKFRDIWRYRDWVIDAFNQDMPFDQFTIEQLAGDLLPQADTQQLLATAFHRNTMANDEGGTDDEEFRVTAVIDRVNTTFEVWQGVSIACVQCHSHPYDPFLHKEFYQAYAFFNNTADNDRYDDFPRIALKSAAQEREIAELKSWLNSHEGDVAYEEKLVELEKIRAGKTPVMQELEGGERRITRLFERGNWLVHGDTVEPAVPAILNEMPKGAPANRLGLAKWLVDTKNPLTARVIVNRFWEQIFGIGLVETLEDFGSQGAKPSNQKLLDHLALQFMHKHKWSVKALLKDILLSATYQQSSKVNPELLEIDPANRYLARGPRMRLSAEQIRDQALAVSGLLSKKMFGPSVMPPQPEGVWQVIRNVLRWVPSEGENRYRRGLYTFWRRSSPYPSLIAFDSPSKEYCVSRRIRTNTPIQALVTLNDSTYLESALALAEQMIDVHADTEEKLAFGYRRASMKYADEGVLNSLKDFYQESENYYQQHPEELRKFLPKEERPQAEKAALVHVANVILNLDEIITKE
ncbi:MAG: PSD1 and planctomycete cytochrome C domain-containing protein [Bacteroidota bacterium]